MILYAPILPRFNGPREYVPTAAKLLPRFLAFKLLFMSGVVKVQAGCPTWYADGHAPFFSSNTLLLTSYFHPLGGFNACVNYFQAWFDCYELSLCFTVHSHSTSLVGTCAASFHPQGTPLIYSFYMV